MDQRRLENEIDQLYQGPPEGFTAARNALAKRAGSHAARIRALTKPQAAAWAVNQLYWRRRETWDALIAAAEEARRAHKAVLSGRAADIRAAGKVHEEAVEDALKVTLSLLADAGHPATDPTRQAVATTLRALPAGEPPGRLSRALQPGGFEALAGLSIAGGAKKPAAAAPKLPVATHRRRAAEPSKTELKAAARAKVAAATAERELRAAENTARREEFESAKATREERKAASAVDQAREAVARARADLDAAEAALRDAARRRDEAETRARRAQAAVAAARTRQIDTAE